MDNSDIVFEWTHGPTPNGQSGADHVASGNVGLRAVAKVPGAELYVVVDIDAYVIMTDANGATVFDEDECRGYSWETCTSACLSTSLDGPWDDPIREDFTEYEQGDRCYLPLSDWNEGDGSAPWWYVADPLAAMVAYVEEAMAANYRSSAGRMIGATPEMVAAIEQETETGALKVLFYSVDLGEYLWLRPTWYSERSVFGAATDKGGAPVRPEEWCVSWAELDGAEEDRIRAALGDGCTEEQTTG